MGTENKTKWGIDPAHSEVGFKMKHLMVASIRGVFREFDASIYTTGEDFMSAEIDFGLTQRPLIQAMPNATNTLRLRIFLM